MIRLLRDVGKLPAGTETGQFSAAEEAAFVSDGTAEAVASRAEVEEPTGDRAEGVDYSKMRKDDLLELAVARGLDVSPRARVPEIIEALESDDDA